MLKIYKKNELLFALVCIATYVLSFSISDAISESIGFSKILTVPIAWFLSFGLYIWFRKNKLADKYGLCVPMKNKLIPLDVLFVLFLLSANFWNGINLRFGIFETVLYIFSMLSVGFLEEVIFRGLLFKALSKDNIKTAIVVSSVTFGVGHIINLLSGADFISTLIQICHACIIGYIFTLIYIRTKSLVFCIIAHSLFNSFDAFSVGSFNGASLLIFTAVLLFVASIYTKVQWKSIKE